MFDDLLIEIKPLTINQEYISISILRGNKNHYLNAVRSEGNFLVTTKGSWYLNFNNKQQEVVTEIDEILGPEYVTTIENSTPILFVALEDDSEVLIVHAKPSDIDEREIISLEKNEKKSIRFEQHLEYVYVVEGEIDLNGETFQQDGWRRIDKNTTIDITATENTRLLYFRIHPFIGNDEIQI